MPLETGDLLCVHAGSQLVDTPESYDSKGTCDFTNPLIVRRGDLIALRGDSGSGKTVLVRWLVDQLRCRGSANVEVATRLTKVGYVSQDLAFFRDISIAGNARSLSGGQPLKDVCRLLPEPIAGVVASRRKYSPAVLSGGQRRALALACAVCADVDLLVLDETLVSMDAGLATVALSLLRRRLLDDARGAVLLVSHDPFVLGHCSRLFEVKRTENGSAIFASQGSARAEVDSGPVESPSTPARDDSAGRNPLPNARWQNLLMAAHGLWALLLLAAAIVLLPLLSADVRRILPGDVGVLAGFTRAWTRVGDHLLEAAWWSLRNSFLAFGVSLVASVAFWFGTLASGPRLRGLAIATWIGAQSIPVVVVALLLVVVLDASGASLEIAVAVFIAAFPLGVIGSRLLEQVPRDTLRAHGAASLWRRFTVSMMHSWGGLVRGVVACCPLAAVGVIVAEYLVAGRGLGRLLANSLTSDLYVRWLYAFSCAAVASVVFLAVTAASIVLLPRDARLG